MPLLVKPPKGTPVKSGVSDSLVELIDFPATVYALTAIDAGYDHFGRSLLPLLAGDTDSHRDAVFCEGGPAARGSANVWNWKVTANRSPSTGPRMRMQMSEGPEHTRAVMCRTDAHKYVRRFYEQDEPLRLAGGPQRNA